MPAQRASFELFALSGGLQGAPAPLPSASFSALGALELQDIERWIRAEPTVVGEELKVLTSQFSGFEGSSDRLDVLGLDRAGRLVVIEIKRDSSGSYQDLQALRYAAFASTFQAEQVVAAYAAYVTKTEGRHPTDDEARAELEAFIEGDSLDTLDEHYQPRMILVATGFQLGVTATVLWLRKEFKMDITCVQLVPFEIGDELVLGSSVLIPLPESADYEVKVAEKHAASKRKTKVDLEQATEFIASIPRGRWSAYGDVAAAGGAPKAAMGVGAWLAKGSGVPNVYRILNSAGEVSEGWKAVQADLPPDPEGVRALLQSEGVLFDESGRADKEQRWRLDDYMSLGGTPVEGASLSEDSTADRGRPAEGGPSATS